MKLDLAVRSQTDKRQLSNTSRPLASMIPEAERAVVLQRWIGAPDFPSEWAEPGSQA